MLESMPESAVGEPGPRGITLRRNASYSEITRVLGRLQAGEIHRRAATDRIFDVACAELPRPGSRLMRSGRSDRTLRFPRALAEATP